MIGAEVAAVTLGQFGPVIAKKYTPHWREKLINSVATNLILPRVDTVQPLMEDMFHAKEDADRWKEAKKSGAKARATMMAEHMTDIALTFPASLGTAMIVKAGIDHAIQSPVGMGRFLTGSAMEGAIHVGLMTVMPKVLPQQMGAFKSGLTKILQSVGFKPETAEKLAMNFTYSGIADFAGFSANMAYQLNHNKGRSK